MDDKSGHIYVLKIDGIQGECDLNHPDLNGNVLLDRWDLAYDFPTDLSDRAFTEGVGNRGKAEQSPLSISNPLGTGGMALMQKIWIGKTIPLIQLFCVNNDQIYLTMNFNQALVSHVHMGGEGKNPILQVRFIYQGVEMSYQPNKTPLNPSPGVVPISNDFSAFASPE